MKHRLLGVVCANVMLLAPLTATASLDQAAAEKAAASAQPGKPVSAAQATSGGKPVWIIGVEHDGGFSEVLIDAETGAPAKGAIDPPPAVTATPSPDC
mgnify:FL=1